MAEVEDRILEYLQQHNFTLAGDALRSEIMARRTSKGALNDPCSSLSEFIANSDNRCSQEVSELWIVDHKLKDRKRLGLAAFNSETSSSLFAHVFDRQSQEGKEAQSREAKEELTGQLMPQGWLQGISSDEKATAWKGGSQGVDEIALSERPVENAQLYMLDSNSKEKSYIQVPQTATSKVSEGQIQYQGASMRQHSVAEDPEKGASKSQRDCDLEVNNNINTNATGFQFTSNCVKTKLPTSNSGIMPALSGDTQLTENGIICDGYRRSSATHVRLKSGFPFSLSSSSYTPPKYQDPNPSGYKSNGTTKSAHKSDDYEGDPSSSHCKNLEGLSNANISDTNCAVVEAEVTRPLLKSADRNANFTHKSHATQHNMSVDDDSSTKGLVRQTGSKQPFVSDDIIEELPKIVQEDVGRIVQSDAFVENWGVEPYEDEDPGYYRQVIEDEAWFLAHEIDYPSDDERGRSNVQVDHDNRNNDDCNYEGHSCASEELLFPGEEHHNDTGIDRDAVTALHHSEDSSVIKGDHGEKLAVGRQSFVEGLDDNISPYHTGMLEREFLTATEGEWYGSKSDIYLNDHDAQFDCEARNSLSERSSEDDPFNYGGHKDELIRSSSSQQRFVAAAESHMNFTEHSFMQNDEEDNEFLTYYDESRIQKNRGADPLDMDETPHSSVKHEHAANIRDTKTFCHEDPDFAGFDFNGFSFPSPSSAGELVGSRAESGKSLWSGRDAMTQSEEIDEFGNGASGADDTLASWRRKSGEFSPVASPQDDGLFNMASSSHSTLSVNLFDDSVSEVRDEDIDDAEASIGDKNYFQAATTDRNDKEALEEQLQKFQACEEEFETFNLRIVHRKNRTGFEEEKDFPVEINSIIAGRYHVTEYLGSAAFSKAIQAHDLYTGMDVCMKIVKNNKDFFDQSLDEIKLLKYINKHDPTDKHHILRLYDYFYHREHLFIVCELLRANLYEFQKYNKESGGEVYFTMPRLQAIARQALEAVEFLHQLGLIHCDLKPENILIKSYNKCEVKVIDMGSSCFQTDSLCSYVQSRSYRAPEVILGLPYDQKIDIWSLGCILAELCCGNVLFQNESLPTLLARVVGIIGPIDTQMLAEGSDAYKYFTKNHMLYERNQETNRLHYIIPRMTSLEHMLPMGDAGFIEFVRYILQVNPKKRPSAGEALNHPWMSYSYEPLSN